MTANTPNPPPAPGNPPPRRPGKPLRAFGLEYPGNVPPPEGPALSEPPAPSTPRPAAPRVPGANPQNTAKPRPEPPAAPPPPVAAPPSPPPRKRQSMADILAAATPTPVPGVPQPTPPSPACGPAYCEDFREPAPATPAARVPLPPAAPAPPPPFTPNHPARPRRRWPDPTSPHTRAFLLLACIVSLLVHVGVGWGVHDRALGEMDPALFASDRDVYRVLRSADDLIVEDRPGPRPVPVEVSDKPALSDLSTALLLADSRPPEPKPRAAAPIDLKALTAPRMTEAAAPGTGGPAPGAGGSGGGGNPLPLDPSAAYGSGPARGPGAGPSPLPTGIVSKLMGPPPIAMPFVDDTGAGSGRTTFGPVAPGGGGGGGGGSVSEQARALLAGTGFSPGGAPSLRPAGIDTGPLDRAPRGPAPDLARLTLPGQTFGEIHLDEDFDYVLRTWRDPKNPAGQSYFRVDITARRSLHKLQHLPKDVIFLIDTSDSIEQDWVQSVVRGVKDGLGTLNEGDRFNIVLFNERVAYFAATMKPVNPQTIAAAQDFLSPARSAGYTDVNQALTRMLVRDTAVERVYELVMISDGVPTRGVLDTRELLNLVTKDNDLQASIYCVGVANKQNRPLLDFLAYRNKGFCVYATPQEPGTAADVIRELMSRLRYPIIKDVRLSAAGVEFSDAFPHDVPNIHQGESFSIFGRYLAAGPFTMRLAGRNGRNLVDFTFTRDLREAPPGDKTIADGWAFWKLHHLYSEMLRQGETPGLKAQIEQLHKEFGLKTLY